jgi:ABC-type transporter Mla subunit MlaD
VLEVQGGALAVAKEAQRCEGTPPSLALFAALLRAAAAAKPNFTDWVHSSDVDAVVAERVAELRGANVAREIRSLRRTVDDLASRIGRAIATLDRTSTKFSDAQGSIEDVVAALARLEQQTKAAEVAG